MIDALTLERAWSRLSSIAVEADASGMTGIQHLPGQSHFKKPRTAWAKGSGCSA